MKTRALPFLALALALPLAAVADEPHGKALDPAVSCTSCHTMHNAPGVSLTSVAGNFNVCASCHNQPGVGAAFGFPWYSQDQALPGASGHSHRWDALLTSRGALPPLDPGMAAKTDGAALQCSTCHDQHNANPQNGGRQYVSVPVDTPLPATTGSGAGTLRVTIAADATSKGYLVDVVGAGDAGTATYRLSNDNGRTWFGWSGSAWVAWTASTPNPRVTGANQELNDGPRMRISFAGAGLAAGDTWSFYVGYPMLRASALASAMCEDCHRAMVHDSARASGLDPAYPPNVAGNTFSHPVGVALGSNGLGHDRAVPLTPDGDAQLAGASSRTDLALAHDGTVRCLTCHAVHNATSNALPQ